MPEREVAPNIATAAALIGDPVRAAMLWSLMGAQARPAGELARIGGVSPQAASGHLGRLVEGGLMRVEARGRHRFYRLAGPDAAGALESLAAMATSGERDARVVSLVPRRLRHARSCWGHLAGELGVALHDRWLALGWFRERGPRYDLSATGEAGLAALGVDAAAVKPGRRGLLHPCLDWSERRPHLGGPLARVLLERLVGQEWLRPAPTGRALALTPSGAERLSALLEGDRGLARPNSAA